MLCVKAMFERGYMIVPYPGSHTPAIRSYAIRRGLGGFLWLAAADDQDRDWFANSPFYGIALADNHPRRIRYEHRMQLKASLPTRSRRLVTWAKRYTQSRFLEEVRKSKATGVRQTGCGSWKEFWRQVRRGPKSFYKQET